MTRGVFPILDDIFLALAPFTQHKRARSETAPVHRLINLCQKNIKKKKKKKKLFSTDKFVKAMMILTTSVAQIIVAAT